jgi:hypothetical protein
VFTHTKRRRALAIQFTSVRDSDGSFYGHDVGGYFSKSNVDDSTGYPTLGVYIVISFPTVLFS